MIRVFQGRSFDTDAEQAMAAATADFSASEPLDIVFIFSSTHRDPHAVMAAARRRFPDVAVVGCTTTGEFLGGAHSNGALVVAGLKTPRLRWHTTLITGLSTLEQVTVKTKVDGLFQALALDREDFDPSHLFGITFVDGLRLREERLSAWLAEALEGIPFLGGSAGDDLKFQQTHVFAEGRAETDAAVLVLAYAEDPSAFSILKHQHFTRTERRLVVTKCDPETRKILELDGEPALDAYARALGLTPEGVTDAVAFMNPLTFSVNGEIYVRSIQKIEADGALTFYCAVEDGMVLDIGGHHDMPVELQRALGNAQAPADTKAGSRKPDFMLMCNCILRALEAQNTGLVPQVDAVLSQSAHASIGFDTYGEQLNGLHINQTLVALALHG